MKKGNKLHAKTFDTFTCFNCYIRCGLKNKTEEKQEVFPVAIQISHDKNIWCAISLQSSDEKELSNMSIVFGAKDSNLSLEEIRQYKEEQRKVDDIIRLFYESDENFQLFTLWDEFCSYWEAPVECEGNRIQRNGKWKNHDFQVKISRSSEHMLWMLESINLSTAEFYRNYEQEMKNVISGYSNYKVYHSMQEMQEELSGSSESTYGAIEAKPGSINYRNEIPYSTFLNDYPNFLASWQGYACGILYDDDDFLNVWCVPRMEQTELILW